MASEPAPSRRWRPRTRGRRVALAVWAGLATFAVLLVLDAIWASTTLVRGLSRARSELATGIESIVTGDPQAAAPHFVAAREAADGALGAVGHPSLGIARLLPVVGENIDAAAAVADASGATAGAGATMVEVARDLRWSDIRIPASAAAGRLDLAAFEAATPGMESVAGRLTGALSLLQGAGGGRLLGPVASGYDDAVEGLARRADLAARFRDALRLMPAMFGTEGPRRYLIVVPALGVPRASGGAPAAVGVLVAQGGALELDPLRPSPRALTQTATSLDWPAAARALLEAAERTGMPTLDGVIGLDAAALEDLVWVAGDVPVDERPLALTDATTETALEIDAFLGTSPTRTARLHAAWASEILARFLAARPALESYALAAARGSRDRHLAVYLTRREDQRLINALGLDGRARLGGEGVLPIAATWSTGERSHVGVLVETAVRHEAVIRPDGSVSVETEVLFRNEAGTEPPSVLLGRPRSAFPVGTFAAEVTLYIPRRARDVVAETSRPSPIQVGRASGFATVTGAISVRGGDSTTLTAAYVVDNAVHRVPGGNEIRLKLVPQPTIAGVRYEVSIVLPDGSSITSASRELSRRGGTAVFSGMRAGPVELQLRYTS